MAFPIIPAAQLLMGGISAITGFQQKKQAEKLAAKNARPDYQIPQEILNAQKMAEMMSLTGMPATQLQKAKQDIQQQQVVAQAAAKDRRAGVASAGALNQQGANQLANLNVADAQARVANIRNLQQMNQAVAGYRDKVAADQMTKYRENAAAIRALQTSGRANLNTALNSALSGVTGMVDAGVFKGKGGNTTASQRIASGSASFKAGDVNQPTYYNGNSATTDYSPFQSPFPNEMTAEQAGNLVGSTVGNSIAQAAQMPDPTMDLEYYKTNPNALTSLLSGFMKR